MNIIRHLQFNLKKYLVLGVFLAIFMPATPALAAEETSNTTGTVDTTTSQAATTGTADIAPTSPEVPPTPVAPAPETVVPETVAPAPDATTSSTNEVPVPAPEVPVCPTHDPLVQGNPDADVTTNAVVNNCLNAGSNSGDASVVGSTGGGSATSGDADVQATLVNMLTSLTNMGAGNLATFVQNVYGDQNGDLHIDPAALAAIVAAQSQLCGCGSMNTSFTGQINNDLNLSANSGDASVTGSRRGGDATTGDASVIANLINIINSIANSGNSFLGTINIYGNLNGDILLPAGFLDGLLANGSPPPEGGGFGGNSSIDTTQSVNNNINMNSQSGSATVADNRRGGDATTGDALTSLNIINLVNRQIVGGNVLLVFVNVMGTWYGVIMDAPVGQNTAVLGGDITQNTDGSACGCLLNGDMSTNSQINNNINLSATSGDASVTGNRRGGNATSGDASTTLNLVNIINSQLSLANWFGILFINVYGTWNGSLGEEPEAPVSAPAAGGSGSTGGVPQLLSFSSPAAKKSSYHSGQSTSGSDGTESSDFDESDDDVLGASTGSDGSSGAAEGASIFDRVWLACLSSLICFFFLGMVDRRHKRSVAKKLPEIIFPTI